MLTERFFCFAGYVELVLTGGNLNFYNAKGDSVRKSIYAGSAALNGATPRQNKTKLVIDGSSKNFVGNKNANDALAGSGNQMVYLNAFGGGLNSTVTASSSVLIRNVFAGFIDTKNGVKKSQLYAGSNIKSQGNYRDGDTQIEVHDSIPSSRCFWVPALFMKLTTLNLNQEMLFPS